jgi:hypothetical protein
MIAESLRGGGCERPQLAAAGYHEPSLVFLAGTSTALVDGAAGADFLKQGGCRFAAIESRHERSFALRAEALGLRYSLLQSIDAINFNGGRRITISIYQAEREP